MPSPRRWRRNSACPRSTSARCARPRGLALVSEELARRLSIVPMRVDRRHLDVAIADGSSAAVRDALARLDVDEVNVYLAPPDDVLTSLNTHYRC